MLGQQRIPVAGELCRDCGKTSAPATMHPVHKLGEAFCSQQCAEAYTVLSCSRCLEPLIAGQGLCRACLVALRQASMDRWLRPRAA